MSAPGTKTSRLGDSAIRCTPDGSDPRFHALLDVTYEFAGICKEILERVEQLRTAEGFQDYMVIKTLAGRGVIVAGAAMDFCGGDADVAELIAVLDHAEADSVL